MIMPPTDDNLDRAAAALSRGDLVAFPTETVYGLGADATNGTAVAAIFETKGRPRFNPLIVHVQDLNAAEEIAVLTAQAKQLAAVNWPGALTLIAQQRPNSPLSDLISAGLDTVALRVPSHPIARTLLQRSGLPIAAPSANRSGHVSPTTAAHVEADFAGSDLLIIDGGATPMGLESTVVDVTSDIPALLRPGAIPRRDIEAVLGCLLAERQPDDALRSPGLLKSHYAPSTKVILNVTEPMPGDVVLAFGPAPHAGADTINLSAAGDLKEAAANLFSALRDLDRRGAKRIAVMPIPSDGLGEAINDRLRRAAA